MITGLRTVQRWWKKTFSAQTAPITGVIVDEYQTWRNRFLWQRLQPWMWLLLICVLTFTLRDIYNIFFPLKEFEDLPEGLKYKSFFIYAGMALSLVLFLALHKTNFGRRHPGLLFIGLSWSFSLSSQIFATLNGFALPDVLAWSLLFLSQAIFMPVCWRLHLMSQVGLLVYYFGVNTALGLKLPPPDTNQPIYSVTLIMYVFWLCAICDLGVYLYEHLQAREFHARKELEQAYKKLEVAESKYRSIFENAIEGIFQSSLDGRYITVNPALARIYGYGTPEDAIANLTDIEHQLYVNPNRRSEFVRLIEKDGSISEFESQIYRQDGSIVWISEKAYAVRDQTGKLLYYEGMIEDITKRKQAEEALRVFFHAVSHDLRNPVIGTLMVVKNLLSHPEEKITIPRSILERMVQSSDRQLNLINSLMEAHASEVQGIILQLESVELHTIVEGAIVDLKPMLIENQATLINSVSADLPTVNADPTQLWRVFSNLIANALKHNPPGLNINITATVEEDKIYCSVCDDGVGMSQQQCARLFDLYFRGSQSRNSVSLGLGLYLCKQIITAHGGEIGVKSTVGKGSNFWFTLPVIPELGVKS
jgi:PAS domain S-box-containing protein